MRIFETFLQVNTFEMRNLKNKLLNLFGVIIYQTPFTFSYNNRIKFSCHIIEWKSYYIFYNIIIIITKHDNWLWDIVVWVKLFMSGIIEWKLCWHAWKPHWTIVWLLTVCFIKSLSWNHIRIMQFTINSIVSFIRANYVHIFATLQLIMQTNPICLVMINNVACINIASRTHN